MDENSGREVISFLRLIYNPNDHLALRTLLGIRRNSLGDVAISSIYSLAQQSGRSFSDMIAHISEEPSLFPKGNIIHSEFQQLNQLVEHFRSLDPGPEGTQNTLNEFINNLVNTILPDDPEFIRNHPISLSSRIVFRGKNCS